MNGSDSITVTGEMYVDAKWVLLMLVDNKAMVTCKCILFPSSSLPQEHVGKTSTFHQLGQKLILRGVR